MSGTLENVLQILSATSDQAFDELADLMKPENHSRVEMQETYEEALGYDPTTYFDRRDMKDIVSRIEDDPNTPDAALDYIKDQGDTLIDDAFEKFDSEREVFLQAAVEQVIEEDTGVEIDADLPEDFEDSDFDNDSDGDDSEDSGEYDESEDDY